MITLEQLEKISQYMLHNPHLAEEYLLALNDTMTKYEINTPIRMAHFIAQCAHESDDFKYFHELWGPTPQQLKYEPPNLLASHLGNTEQGDGFKYRGRGVLQTTGKANYELYSHLLGVDLVNNPDLLATPKYAFLSAGAFWDKHQLNAIADKDDVLTITRVINGGYIGLEDRKNKLTLCKRVIT